MKRYLTMSRYIGKIVQPTVKRTLSFNNTFSNISVISWWLVLLVEEKYPEKTTDLSKVTDKLYHIMLYRVHLTWMGFELTTLVVIGIDCTCSCKSNYHIITTTTILNIQMGNSTILKKLIQKRHMYLSDSIQMYIN